MKDKLKYSRRQKTIEDMIKALSVVKYRLRYRDYKSSQRRARRYQRILRTDTPDFELVAKIPR